MTKTLDKSKLPQGQHPCFSKSAYQAMRLHLPVAPKCNIQCAYCDRKFSCVNESRPGVTTQIISPDEALSLAIKAHRQAPNLTVIGIAGPGDPLANPERTLKTLSLIRQHLPDLILCLSTNGLYLSEHLEQLVEIGVSHLTVTVNAIDPKIGVKIYQRVEQETGEAAAERLCHQQLTGIRSAVAAGMTVKVNSVLIPEINDEHLIDVAKKVRECGAHLFNPIPLLPVAGTTLASCRQPDCSDMEYVRLLLADIIPVMTHCQRCRADAFGVLSQSGTIADLLKDSEKP